MAFEYQIVCVEGKVKDFLKISPRNHMSEIDLATYQMQKRIQNLLLMEGQGDFEWSSEGKEIEDE